jgi:hypothetical protein
MSNEQLGAIREQCAIKKDLSKTMRRRTPEQRYNYNVRKQQKILEDYAEHELEWANDLMSWYRHKKIDMPEDEYRACAFFQNREYKKKPGSLTLLYEVYLRCIQELPKVTKENAIDLLRFQFKFYYQALIKGGY